MQIAILSPGPSLPQFSGAPDATTIGVNRAATLFACDWLAAIDYTLIEKYSSSFLGSPKWLTNQNSFEHFARQDHPWGRREHVTTDWLRRNYLDTRQFSWTLYSFTSALVFAAYLGATRVDIYGADFAGVADWDGEQPVDHPDMRNQQRWDGERKLYERIKGWMEQRGIEVVRHERQETSSASQIERLGIG